MKLRKITILFLIILFTILQSTALNYIRIFKTKPDILLILIIFFSLNFGQIYGLGIGALCGLFSEATCGLPAGSVVFTYSLGGFILGYIGRLGYNQKVYEQMSISFIFCFAIYFLLFFLFQIFNMNLPVLNTLIFIILPASFYTAIVSPLFFHFLKIILNIK